MVSSSPLRRPVPVREFPLSTQMPRPDTPTRSATSGTTQTTAVQSQLVEIRSRSPAKPPPPNRYHQASNPLEPPPRVPAHRFTASPVTTSTSSGLSLKLREAQTSATSTSPQRPPLNTSVLQPAATAPSGEYVVAGGAGKTQSSPTVIPPQPIPPPISQPVAAPQQVVAAAAKPVIKQTHTVFVDLLCTTLQGKMVITNAARRASSLHHPVPAFLDIGDLLQIMYWLGFFNRAGTPAKHSATRPLFSIRF